MERVEAPEQKWIRLDYLEFLCQAKTLVLGCRSGDEEVWISPLGSHPQHFSRQKTSQIVQDTREFEVIQIIRDLDVQYSLTRQELANEIRRLVN